MQIKVPPVGESITEGILVEWLKKSGDAVRADEPLFVLETDKVTMTINAEASGRLSILVLEGERVDIGQVVGSLRPLPEEEVREALPTGEPRPGEEPHGPPPSDRAAEEVTVPQSEGPGMHPPAGVHQAIAKIEAMDDPEEMPPSVRRLVEEHSLDPRDVQGTGKGGRITKEDVLRHLRESEHGAASPGGSKAVPESTPAKEPEPPETEPAARQTRTAMSPIRQRIAERLVQAKNTAAILTTFNEADMAGVLEWRRRHQERFLGKHGIKLGLMSFFVKATVDALQAVPALNAQIQGNEIVQNHFFDIGIAVQADHGLVVPVIRDADRLGFAEVELEVQRLAQRARERTVTLEDLTGGVFSISNGGVYGNLLSTPIINPPQSGILGMHAIQKRPVVVEDRIEIRPMMYLAVSYDHRLVDGREAVTFLKRIVECVETPERMLLEI